MAIQNAVNLTSTGLIIGAGDGTFSSTTTTNHNLLIGAASNAITNVAPSATSGVPVISQGASSDPTFGTAVVAGGGTGVTTMTTAYAPVCAGTTATGALQVASTGLGSSGFVLTSNGSSSLPSFQAATGGGLAWALTTVNASIVAANGYIANKAGLLTMTLPASSSIGDIFEITNINTAAGWLIAQNAGQQMRLGTSTTTVGVSGSLAASALGDSLRAVCTTSGSSSVWTVLSSFGNITVV